MTPSMTQQINKTFFFTFQSQLSFQEKFTPTLEDPNSEEFIQLAETVSTSLLLGLQDVEGLQDVQVTKFSQGSVVADYIMVLDPRYTLFSISNAFFGRGSGVAYIS